MTERKRVSLLIGATALSVLLVAFASRLPAPAPLVAGIGVIPLALLLALWRRCTPVVAAKPLVTTPPPPPAAPPVPMQVAAPAELMLAEIAEAAILCDEANHRIIAANAAAATLFARPPKGEVLSAILPIEPILRGLSGLAVGQSAAIACAGRQDQGLLRGRIRRQDGAYLVILSTEVDSSAGLRQQARQRTALRELRRPLANLRAAVETVIAFPTMTARERAAFDEVIAEECANLGTSFQSLETSLAAQAPALHSADIHSQDLFNCLSRHLAAHAVRLNMVGIPLWVHGDSRALLAALSVLAENLAQATKQRDLDFEALLADRRIYVDLSWPGPAIPAAMVDLWLDMPLGNNPETLREALERHGCEPWSQQTARQRSVLRIPLPPPHRPQFVATDRPRHPRPEIHDLELMRRHLPQASLPLQPLARQDFVVFDCETTGLRPDGGDRVIQIGAVRVAGTRVLAAESFERLIDPGRPIPVQSQIYHGISDDMVVGKPPLLVVLPQFSAFAGNAVLVGHNVAFDLAFLDAAAEDSGVGLRQPVLDTMILAALLDPDYDLSLPALAERWGVPALPHRSALSDCLLTAGILVRMLPRLEAQGLGSAAALAEASLDWLVKGQRP